MQPYTRKTGPMTAWKSLDPLDANRNLLFSSQKTNDWFHPKTPIELCCHRRAIEKLAENPGIRDMVSALQRSCTGSGGGIWPRDCPSKHARGLNTEEVNTRRKTAGIAAALRTNA
mmetsp:Transcript_21980/g.89293  ORF Transcript_21980/g.89293 Transcript_21980/m.89293 type:complete len:115 (+) Transcript_21980:2426-2770(+)